MRLQLMARYQATSTAAGAQPVWVPQSSITTRSPEKPRLPSLRSPWTRVEGNRDRAAASDAGRSSTASTGSATSAGATSANRSQPRPISRGTSSAPPASRRAVAGERNPYRSASEHSSIGGSPAKAACRAAAASRTRRLSPRLRRAWSGTRAAETSRMITTQPPGTCSAPTTAWSMTSGTRASTPADHSWAARPWSAVARMIQSPPSRTCLTTSARPSARTARSSRLPERPSAAASGSLETTSASSDVTTRPPLCACSQGQDRRPGCSPVAATSGALSRPPAWACACTTRGTRRSARRRRTGAGTGCRTRRGRCRWC
jgi:hypothetical protein